jgi:hypothetical protein
LINNYPSPVAPDTLIIYQTYTVIPLGEIAQEKANTRIYPNPFTDQIRILYDKTNGKSVVKIYRADGCEVYSDTISGELEWVIDSHSWNSGFYIILLRSVNGNTHSYKVLKR